MSLTRVSVVSRTLVSSLQRCLYATEAGKGSASTAGGRGKTPKPAAAPPAAPATDGNSYECGEFYQHTEFSFYDIECQLVKMRTVPQPSKYDKPNAPAS